MARTATAVMSSAIATVVVAVVAAIKASHAIRATASLVIPAMNRRVANKATAVAIKPRGAVVTKVAAVVVVVVADVDAIAMIAAAHNPRDSRAAARSNRPQRSQIFDVK